MKKSGHPGILWPFILFAAVVGMVFYPAFTAPSGFTLFGDDFFRSYGFFREFFAQSLHKGTIPWWNPYLFSGSPFLSNPSLSYLYPPDLLYAVLPVSTAWTLLVIGHVMLSMAGMYVFVRSVLKLDRWAGIGAGIAFGLSGYFMARIWAGHSEIVSSAAYLPWVMAAFMSAFTTRSFRYVALSAAVVALQILAGYQTIAMFTLEAAGIAALTYAVLTKSVKPLGILILAVTFAVGLSAVQLIPNIRYFQESIRTYAFGYDWAAYGSIAPANLKEIILPFALGDKISYAGTPPNYPEQAMFAGTLTIVLAVIGFFGTVLSRGRGSRMMLLAGITATVVAVFALWVSLGANAPFNLHRLLWETIPLYRNLRIPPRHLILFEFGIATLAAIGIQTVRPRILRTAAVIILILEMVPFARHFVEVKPAPGSQHDQGLVRLLKADTAPYRFLPNFGVWVPPRDALDFDAVMPYGIFSATGYDPSILKNYYAFADAVNGNVKPSILQHDVQIPYLNVWSPYIDFLNIKYILVPRGYDPIGGDRAGKFRLLREVQARDFRLYENLTVLPRFFLVPSLTISATPEMVAEKIRTGGADLTQTVLTAGTDPAAQGGNRPDCGRTPLPPVDVVSYGVNRIVLATRADCNAYLSSSEVMYPGWQAYIDGKRAQIIESNMAFRALYVPLGKHTVEMRFVPVDWYLGLAVSVMSAGVLWFGILRRGLFPSTL